MQTLLEDAAGQKLHTQNVKYTFETPDHAAAC